MNTWLSNHDHPNDTARGERPAWPDVAGMVLRAARISAGLDTEQLAAAAGLEEKTIDDWETGAEPLASVSVTQIKRLKDALRSVNAREHLVADLDAATWCDVVLGAMTSHADINCLLADPLARERVFGELLSWAISGHMPARYARLTPDVVSQRPE